jgi:hypothetical protein
MPATAALPTLSQVQTLDTAYLREAGEYWTRTANLWEQAFTEVNDRMSTPGGIPWKGEAAAAAQERSHSDLVQVRGASDQLHAAAAVALRGDEQLRASKEAVLEAVQDARAEGFSVGEDFGHRPLMRRFLRVSGRTSCRSPRTCQLHTPPGGRPSAACWK